jgi:hypothetical protein
MQLTPDALTRFLAELADWLDHYDCDPVEWVVCGGVALALQGLLTRTTRDVDILGNWDTSGFEIAGIADFPKNVKLCIERVIQDHPELQGTRWINLGPRRLVEFGLPDGFEGRLHAISFGPRLTLQLLGRADLVALKLFAAADVSGSRQDVHYNDLEILKPTEAELNAAVHWTRTLPDFDFIRADIKDAVCRLGHDELGYYI